MKVEKVNVEHFIPGTRGSGLLCSGIWCTSLSWSS